MKKLTAILLLVSVLFLFSCGETSPSVPTETEPAETTVKVKKDVQLLEYEIDPENHTEDQLNYINGRAGQVSNYAWGDSEKSRPNPFALNFKDEVAEGLDSYVIEIADNKDFENSFIVEGLDKPEYNYYNPQTGSDVYFRGADSNDNLDNVNIFHFTVTSVLPRLIYVDGVSNVRDIGGYATSLVEGGTVKQGLYYRGANLDDITKEGKKEMLDRLGIRCELDLRESATAKGPAVEGMDYHAASIPLGVEDTIFEEFAEQYYEIFTCISEADEKPVYLHCTAGADRTGISTFMLMAVLGIDYSDIARDYLFTNFSVFGTRTLAGSVDTYEKKLREFEGDNLAEQAKNWLMSKGVEEEKIEKIRTIFIEGYGE